MYQGHLPDGSSVQRHSAGGIYPFVPFARQSARGLNWGLITPGGRELMVGPYAEAIELAVQLKAGSACALRLAEMRSSLLAANSLEGLETLSGEPREEPANHPRDGWADRDFGLWYDGLIKAGITSDQEMNALQRGLCDQAHGKPMPAASMNRYQALRAMAEDALTV